MHPMSRTLRVRALAVAIVAAALTALTPAWAEALPVDDVPQARHRIVGSHITNHHTHLETWIVGFYRYRREVRIHGDWRAKRFYGLRVSAQRCDRSHCWGRTVGGKLWSPHQPGRRLRSSRTADPTAGRSATSARSDLCLQGTTRVRRPVELVRRATSTSASASSSAGSSIPAPRAAWRVVGWWRSRTSRPASCSRAVCSPQPGLPRPSRGHPGMALGALAGCMVGEGSSGVKTVKALVSALNPFDRGAGAHG